MVGLVACSVTYPVVVIGENGEMYKGSTTATLDTGSFEVSRGNIVCGGNFSPLNTSPTIAFPVTCNNGLKGIATVTRDDSLQAGSGTVRMSDGSEWNILFGNAAAAF